MIYKKDANFPYPVLTNTSNSYYDNHFSLDVTLSESVDHYRFDFKYDIESTFINTLLKTGQAKLILIIQSKDNRFYKLEYGQNSQEIPKSRISLSKRTSIQLHIQSQTDISFKDNQDLSEFYNQFKGEIFLKSSSLLGFSNIVMFDGSNSKPYELFEKKVDLNLKSEIKVVLGSETINLYFRNPEFQFGSLPKSNALNNMYIYLGLQKALLNFIDAYGQDGEVDLNQIEPPTKGLDFKLHELMKAKLVEDINKDSVDEVIYAISDRIITKYSSAVKGLVSDGN